MKRQLMLLFTCIALSHGLFSQNRLSINYPQSFDYAPLFKKKQLFQTIDSFLLVADDYTKGVRFWEKADIDRWGYPDAFIFSGKRKPVFLGAVDFVPRSKYLVKLASFSPGDSLNQTNLYCVYSIIANYNEATDRFTFEHYSSYFVQDWFQKKIGNITFYKEKKSEFNKREAKACNKFNSSIAAFFGAKPKEITYYSCESPMHYFKLKGYDFVHETFYRTGGTIAYGGIEPPFKHIVYAGINQEIYKHEITHFYIDHHVTTNTCRVAMEGLATYLGGGTEQPLRYHLKTLYEFLKNNPSFTLNDMLFNEKRISDTVSTLYATGGLFAKLIYEKRRLVGIKKYLDTPCDQLINVLSELLAVKQEDLYEYAMSELKKETENE